MWIVFALLAALAGAVLAMLTKTALKDVDSSLALAVQSVLILAISWGAAAVQGSLGKLGEIDGRYFSIHSVSSPGTMWWGRLAWVLR